MRIRWRYALLALLFSAAVSPSSADDIDELRKLRDTTISLVNALVEQGVLTRAKADAIIAQAQQAGAKPPGGAASSTAPAAIGAPAAAEPPPAPGVVRVPYVPETVKQEIAAEVKQDVLAQAKTERWGEPGAFPDWLKRFYWSGDIRVRFETDRFPNDGTPNAPVAILQSYGVNIANDTEADNRLRFRARFGFEAAVADSVTVGMRLASGGVGAGGNPGSENQTLGTYENRETVGFDRAFIAYHPLRWLDMSAGVVGNPFFRPTTLIWADDVSLGGVVMHFRPQLTENLKFFTIAGAFPILQNDPTPVSSAASKWLYAYQSGIDWKFQESSGLRVGAALYDYRNIEGIPNPTIFSSAYNNTAATYRQTGNTVFDINGLLNTQNGTQNYLYGLASKFHEVNVSAALDLGFVGPTHILIDGDWVKNLGFNEGEIERRTGYQVDRQIKGWQTRVTVGYPTMQQKYAWQVYVGYRYVQRDATLDAWTDQDFHLGGTDAQGYFLGARYSFERNTFVNLRWFSAKQIDGVELAGADSSLGGLPLAIDVMQLDVMSSF
jgi:Putative porin